MRGHTVARAYLERELPVATLLHGPDSVGKWTLANHLADHHKVSTVDRWAVPQGLTVDTVKLVTAYAARPPVGPFKLITARLDSSSRAALNALLKTLEEPPPQVKFLLVSASHHLLPTISSRCLVFELGMLSQPELENIYRDQGVPQGKAYKAARYARGQVRRGYDMDGAEGSRTQIINLAKALASGDRALFDNVFAIWDIRSTQLLTTFFTECLTLRWNTFSSEDTAGLHHDRRTLWRMMTAVVRLPRARPRLGVRVALEPFLSRQ